MHIIGPPIHNLLVERTRTLNEQPPSLVYHIPATIDQARRADAIEPPDTVIEPIAANRLNTDASKQFPELAFDTLKSALELVHLLVQSPLLSECRLRALLFRPGSLALLRMRLVLRFLGEGFALGLAVRFGARLGSVG